MGHDELIAALAAGDDTALRVLFCQYALLEARTAPWTWPVRPPADRGAWICACAVFVAGLLLFAIRGPRTRLSDDS